MLNNTVTLHKATSSFPLDHAFVGDAVRQLSRAPDYRRDLLRVRMEHLQRPKSYLGVSRKRKRPNIVL